VGFATSLRQFLRFLLLVWKMTPQAWGIEE
jgi:hypothetical protein